MLWRMAAARCGLLAPAPGRPSSSFLAYWASGSGVFDAMRSLLDWPLHLMHPSGDLPFESDREAWSVPSEGPCLPAGCVGWARAGCGLALGV